MATNTHKGIIYGAGISYRGTAFNFTRDYYDTFADLEAEKANWNIYFPKYFITNVGGVLYQYDGTNFNKFIGSGGTEEISGDISNLAKEFSGKLSGVTKDNLVVGGENYNLSTLANGNDGEILQMSGGSLTWATPKVANSNTAGVVKPGTGLSVDTGGTLSVNAATASVFGGVMVGPGLTSDKKGLLSVAPDLTTIGFKESGDGNFTLRVIDGATLNNIKLSGTTTVSDPTNTASTSTQVANVKYVQDTVNGAIGGLSQALKFKGTISQTNAIPTTGSVGDVYVCSEAGKYKVDSGTTTYLEVGDTLIYGNNTWNIVQANITGAVTKSKDLTKGTLLLSDGTSTVTSLANGVKGYVLQMEDSGPVWKPQSTYSLTPATTGACGGVIVGSGLSVDGDGKISVSSATTGVTGGVKIGYNIDKDNKNYPLALDANGNAYVNVPWSDTNNDTKYEFESGATGFFSVKASSASDWTKVSIGVPDKAISALSVNVPKNGGGDENSLLVGAYISGTTSRPGEEEISYDTFRPTKVLIADDEGYFSIGASNAKQAIKADKVANALTISHYETDDSGTKIVSTTYNGSVAAEIGVINTGDIDGLF